MPESITSSEKNIYQRINAVMASIANVVREDISTGLRYKYISYNAVVGKVRDAWIEHGIVMTMNEVEHTMLAENRALIKFEIAFINVDNPSDFVSSIYSGIGIGTDDKTVGKALSYAQKNAILKTFSLIGSESEEVDADQTETKAPSKKTSAPPVQQSGTPFQPAAPSGGFPAYTRK